MFDLPDPHCRYRFLYQPSQKSEAKVTGVVAYIILSGVPQRLESGSTRSLGAGRFFTEDELLRESLRGAQ